MVQRLQTMFNWRSVDLAVTPVRLTYTPECFYVPDQGSCCSILSRINQHGLIIDRGPEPTSQRRPTEFDHIEDENTACRGFKSDSLNVCEVTIVQTFHGSILSLDLFPWPGFRTRRDYHNLRRSQRQMPLQGLPTARQTEAVACNSYR